MITYEDCLGLGNLSAEEVAAIARHEHLPEIVALEMGSRLCTTAEGQRVIQRMILDDIEDALAHGRTTAAAQLQLVLRYFLENHPDQHWSEGFNRLLSASGLDSTAASTLRARADSYLAMMLRHFGLNQAQVRDRFGSEMLTAATRCAACRQTERCRRFLAGLAEDDAPRAFCPSAGLFEELRHRSLHRPA